MFVLPSGHSMTFCIVTASSDQCSWTSQKGCGMVMPCCADTSRAPSHDCHKALPAHGSSSNALVSRWLLPRLSIVPSAIAVFGSPRLALCCYIHPTAQPAPMRAPRAIIPPRQSQERKMLMLKGRELGGADTMVRAAPSCAVCSALAPGSPHAVQEPFPPTNPKKSLTPAGKPLPAGAGLVELQRCSGVSGAAVSQGWRRHHSEAAEPLGNCLYCGSVQQKRKCSYADEKIKSTALPYSLLLILSRCCAGDQSRSWHTRGSVPGMAKLQR